MRVHLDVLAGFVAFGVVAAGTPGPNNLMLMTSGVKFGFARTVPHLAGVVLGFSLMVALVGLGLDAVFQRVPGERTNLAPNSSFNRALTRSAMVRKS